MHPERAKLRVVEALNDLGATSREEAATTKEVDEIVGNLSNVSGHSNFKTVQEMLRDGIIEMSFDTPMKIWLTPKGIRYYS